MGISPVNIRATFNPNLWPEYKSKGATEIETISNDLY